MARYVRTKTIYMAPDVLNSTVLRSDSLIGSTLHLYSGCAWSPLFLPTHTGFPVLLGTEKMCNPDRTLYPVGMKILLGGRPSKCSRLLQVDVKYLFFIMEKEWLVPIDAGH